jgi:hypothetical protein
VVGVEPGWHASGFGRLGRDGDHLGPREPREDTQLQAQPPDDKGSRIFGYLVPGRNPAGCGLPLGGVSSSSGTRPRGNRPVRSRATGIS